MNITLGNVSKETIQRVVRACPDIDISFWENGETVEYSNGIVQFRKYHTAVDRSPLTRTVTATHPRMEGEYITAMRDGAGTRTLYCEFYGLCRIESTSC